MKKAVLMISYLFFAGQAHSATVTDIAYDMSGKYLLIGVATSGGCGAHDFSLEVGACFETFPVQCTVKLIESTEDSCEALISGTAVIKLSDYNLDTDTYFSNGFLTVTGDVDSLTGKPSSVSIQLPEIKEVIAPQQALTK